ncbi:MAG: tyrosinase family protein [Acidobacteriota bacterium]
MKVELQINSSVSPGARFVAWAPSPCRIRVTDPAGAASPVVNVNIAGKSMATGGAVAFRTSTTGAFSNSLTLPVPISGASVPFFVAGKFGRPSVNNGDVTIEARTGTTLVGSVQVMVRIRKNANTLTSGERDRLISAFAQLNNQGAGRFTDFRDMHVEISLRQSHRAAGFLPWHRAYLLDLERELQAIDASVALPYWRFDRPAPNIFTREFLGVADSIGAVQFNPGHPLLFWRTDGMLGIDRQPLFNTGVAPPNLFNEAETLGLGSQYKAFRAMEGNPHGFAHTSFDGFISDAATAPKDPLFFLLHCNADRLWAKWQRRFNRFDSAVTASYDSNPANRLGHNLPDTMWPWNGLTGNTRPPTAPGGALAVSPCVSAPGPQPRVRDGLDYQGSINAVSRMGFDYDDVPFA